MSSFLLRGISKWKNRDRKRESPSVPLHVHLSLDYIPAPLPHNEMVIPANNEKTELQEHLQHMKWEMKQKLAHKVEVNFSITTEGILWAKVLERKQARTENGPSLFLTCFYVPHTSWSPGLSMFSGNTETNSCLRAEMWMYYLSKALKMNQKHNTFGPIG